MLNLVHFLRMQCVFVCERAGVCGVAEPGNIVYSSRWWAGSHNHDTRSSHVNDKYCSPPQATLKP